MAIDKSGIYFDSCCFCISLKTGCFIMAYIQLVGIILGIIGSLVFVTYYLAEANSKFQYISAIWYLVSFFAFFLMFCILLFNILLVIGLHKKKPGLVNAYIIFDIIMIVVFAILLLTAMATGVVTFPSMILRFAQLLSGIYYLLVYKSYYHVMKEGTDVTANNQG